MPLCPQRYCVPAGFQPVLHTAPFGCLALWLCLVAAARLFNMYSYSRFLWADLLCAQTPRVRGPSPRPAPAQTPVSRGWPGRCVAPGCLLRSSSRDGGVVQLSDAPGRRLCAAGACARGVGGGCARAERENERGLYHRGPATRRGRAARARAAGRGAKSAREETRSSSDVVASLAYVPGFGSRPDGIADRLQCLAIATERRKPLKYVTGALSEAFACRAVLSGLYVRLSGAAG